MYEGYTLTGVRLEAELEQARTQRAQVQRRREELVRRAKTLQEKSKKIRNHCKYDSVQLPKRAMCHPNCYERVRVQCY